MDSCVDAPKGSGFWDSSEHPEPREVAHFSDEKLALPSGRKLLH